MYKSTLTLITVVLVSFSCFSQKRTCATMDVLNRQIANDPQAAESVRELNRHAEEYSNNVANNRSSSAIINIPVVFHVVYQNATENIPDQQILSQLKVLNDDYNRQNADTNRIPSAWKGIAANMEVNFCLAQRDPAGNPTTGITRTATAVTAFSDNDDIKYTSKGGKSVWDASKYLNIWVGDLGSSLLGYAQFPGQLPATDGVVIHYKYTGVNLATHPYDKGRTLTHEVGHYFGLYHIWGDDGGSCTGTDNVSDTPSQGSENYGCPTFPKTDACQASSPGVMFMNYMDYTDDACMYMFSNGQKTRVRSVITTGSRKTLSTSNGCIPPVTIDAALTNIIKPAGSTCNIDYTPIVTLLNNGSSVLTSATINYSINGGSNNTYSWSGTLPSTSSINITLPIISPGTGTHSITATVSNPNATTDGNTTNNTQTKSFEVITNATSATLPFVEGFEAATFPPTGWTLVNPEANNKWIRATVGGSGLSSASAKMDNFTGSININGQIDELISPNINFLSADTSLQMTFAVAHARYKEGYYDTLMVEITTNCGDTWQTIYKKGGVDLQTKTTLNSGSAFTPTAVQWRNEKIDLPSYAGINNAQFRFKNISGSGNNIFIDDINISNFLLTGIFTRVQNSLSVYPNPSTGIVNLLLPDNIEANISVYNYLGEIVESFNGFGKITLDLSSKSSGVYYVKAQTTQYSVTKVVTISK